MSYPIEKDMISANPRYPLAAKKIIVAHDSGNAANTGDGSLAAEVSYMKRNWQNAFVHAWVNDKKIVQLAEPGYKCWGAGRYANPISPFQVELARVDTQEEFDESYKRYVWLLRHMADRFGIPKTLDSAASTGIKTHAWISKNLGGTNHMDPYGYLAKWGISESEFKRDIEKGIEREVVTVSKGYWMKGDKGAKVLDIQEDINFLGYKPKLTEDSIYGQGTKDAVIWFQKKHKLEDDGIAGAATLKKLASEVKAKKAADEKKNEAAKPAASKKAEWRVLDGKESEGAYADNANALKAVERLMKKNVKEIKVENI